MNLKQVIFGGDIKNASGGAGAYRDSIQAWLPVKGITDGIIVTRDDRFIKVCEVLPVNFYLRSPADRENIIVSFAAYLKIAPSTLQILVRTQKADMRDYISRMKSFAEAEENERCREMIEDNISEVSRLGSGAAITRRFFLAFEHEPQMKARYNTVKSIAERLAEEADTARRYLDVCGLEVLEPRYVDNMLLELLYELINKKTAHRVKLPNGVFDMTTAVHGLYEEA
ncbi:MAG: hypothetical protein LUC36_03025 [Oscillospiraceae bacterium]|nr:hypothetical protein [Oscillospiraceae bacterium]